MTEPTILLKNDWQARKVRIFFWATLLVGALALWGGWAIYQSFGLSAADGGVLRPQWQRLALGGFVAALGIAAAAGMLLYVSLYALRIERDGDRTTITTMTPFGSRAHVFDAAQLGAAAYYHGRVHHVASSGRPGGLWVDAPWITLRAAGRRFPFIIDLQAEVIDVGTLEVLAEGAVDAWQQDRG